MSLLFKKVEFQTDITSYGVGRVVKVYSDTDEVRVLDEEGGFWRGPLDLVSLADETERTEVGATNTQPRERP